MRLTHTELSSGTVDEKAVETTVRGAIEIKTRQGGGSVGASYTNAKGEKVTAEHLSRSIQFKVEGGDTTLASNPVDWPATVKKATNWTVIGRKNLVSILEWLPETLRKRVLAQWPKVALLPAIREGVRLSKGPSWIGKAEQAQFLIGIRNDFAPATDSYLGSWPLLVALTSPRSYPMAVLSVAWPVCTVTGPHDIWIDSTAPVCRFP
ncbi:MAG: hypothetical protein IPK92_14730 [Nitrospira sp.]|nr:hypothetical protein [Nitrospira sp.]